jgi:hypothetical protein
VTDDFVMTNQTLPGQPPAYDPPPEPPTRSFRKRHPKTFWALVIIGGLIALSIITSALSPKDDSGNVTTQSEPSASSSSSTGKAATKPTTSAKQSAAPAKQGPGVGDEARDGKFGFTVTRVRCGIKKVGNDFLNARAQGQFCLVGLTVKNIGDEPQTMFSNDQKGFIGDTEYAADDTATIYVAKDGNSPWLKEINPGNILTGTIVYDIPKGKKLTKLELHDSPFSEGVEVHL